MGEEVNRRIIYPDDKPIQQNGLTMPINIPIPVSQIPIDVGSSGNQEIKLEI